MRKTNVERLEAAVAIQAAHFGRFFWPKRHTAHRAAVRQHVATQRATRAELKEAKG